METEIICKKKVVLNGGFNSGKVAFSKGKTYKVKEALGEWVAKDNHNTEHYVGVVGDEWFDEHFYLIKPKSLNQISKVTFDAYYKDGILSITDMYADKVMLTKEGIQELCNFLNQLNLEEK